MMLLVCCSSCMLLAGAAGASDTAVYGPLGPVGMPNGGAVRSPVGCAEGSPLNDYWGETAPNENNRERAASGDYTKICFSDESVVDEAEYPPGSVPPLHEAVFHGTALQDETPQEDEGSPAGSSRASRDSEPTGEKQSPSSWSSATMSKDSLSPEPHGSSENNLSHSSWERCRSAEHLDKEPVCPASAAGQGSSPSLLGGNPIHGHMGGGRLSGKGWIRFLRDLKFSLIEFRHPANTVNEYLWAGDTVGRDVSERMTVSRSLGEEAWPCQSAIEESFISWILVDLAPEEGTENGGFRLGSGNGIRFASNGAGLDNIFYLLRIEPGDARYAAVLPSINLLSSAPQESRVACKTYERVDIIISSASAARGMSIAIAKEAIEEFGNLRLLKGCLAESGYPAEPFAEAYGHQEYACYSDWSPTSASVTGILPDVSNLDFGSPNRSSSPSVVSQLGTASGRGFGESLCSSPLTSTLSSYDNHTIIECKSPSQRSNSTDAGGRSATPPGSPLSACSTPEEAQTAEDQAGSKEEFCAVAEATAEKPHRPKDLQCANRSRRSAQEDAPHGWCRVADAPHSRAELYGSAPSEHCPLPLGRGRVYDAPGLSLRRSRRNGCNIGDSREDCYESSRHEADSASNGWVSRCGDGSCIRCGCYHQDGFSAYPSEQRYQGLLGDGRHCSESCGCPGFRRDAGAEAEDASQEEPSEGRKRGLPHKYTVMAVVSVITISLAAVSAAIFLL